MRNHRVLIKNVVEGTPLPPPAPPPAPRTRTHTHVVYWAGETSQGKYLERAIGRCDAYLWVRDHWYMTIYIA